MRAKGTPNFEARPSFRAFEGDGFSLKISFKSLLCEGSSRDVERIPNADNNYEIKKKTIYICHVELKSSCASLSNKLADDFILGSLIPKPFFYFL